MAPRTLYANLADGLQPFSLWDQSLADMGSLGVIPCTAVGTNAIVLTPIAAVFAPTVATPQSLQAFSFVAAASSSGAVTIQIGSTAALKLYRMDGVTQASTGDLLITVTYLINYNAALNSGAGGFQILAPIANEINPIISGATISGSTITTSTYNGNIWTAGTGTLTIAAGKTETFNNTLTFAGTDGSSIAFGAGGTVVYTSNNLSVFAATTSAQLSGILSDETGSGGLAVFNNGPTLIAPVLGAATATSINGNTFTTGTYTLTGVAGKTFTFSNTLTLAGTDASTLNVGVGGTLTGSSSAAIWYDNIPQNSKSAAYTTVLADAQKHIFHPSADTTARTWTIDSNANVAYPIGTAITFVNQNAGGVITIAITTDTMRLAGAGTTGNRSLAANGIATALKLTSTEWLISGTGLT